ncbi:MAG: FHA domain-containing protein [Hyphomicrobiaceae bacterium]
MLVTILMLGLALACAVIGIWAMRRPATVDDKFAARPVAAPAASQPVTELRPRPSAESAPRVPVAAAASPTTAEAPRPQTGSAPAPASPASSLAFLDFDGSLGRIHVQRTEVVIGRHTQDDIRINDVRVSRHHARLVAKRDGGFEIHNLTAVRSEPNPMQINGETREHADIADGDVVTLGGVSFTFRHAA